jgi:hypothetical protein
MLPSGQLIVLLDANSMSAVSDKIGLGVSGQCVFENRDSRPRADICSIYLLFLFIG